MQNHIRKCCRLLLLIIPVVLFCAACAEAGYCVTTGVVKDENYGSVYTVISPNELEALGFALGDSIDVVFDNGYALEDIPYLNGYYVGTGEPLACAYPGNTYIAVCRAQGSSVWEESGAREDTQITIKLREKGK